MGDQSAGGDAPARVVDARRLGLILEAARLADQDGDEWDMDDVPDASLALVAMCGPSTIIRMVEELLSSRGIDKLDPIDTEGVHHVD